MKIISLTFLATFFTFSTFAQLTKNQKLIELGKTYKDFMFRNVPSKNVVKNVKSNVPENLKIATEFIIQCITSNNKILTHPYLTRPDDNVLKQIYIIRAIDHNFSDENPIEINKLIDSLSNKFIPSYELVDNYYGMLFTAVGNKNQPFNLSRINFKTNEYNLKDDTEVGIMFLRCMDYCGMTIWGYMNVVKPSNTSKATSNILKFPKFNDRVYYQYNDLYFPDFEMNIIKDKGMQSYKSYYLDKYYEVLLSHLVCLDKEGGSEKEINDLLLGSILKERNLYKYTKYKKTLEEIFKVQSRD